MATTYTCDICGYTKYKDELIKIRIEDGKHPHCGKTMYKTLDACVSCINKRVKQLWSM